MRHAIASLFTLILISSPVVAYGQTVTAMWDPSPPSDQVTSYQACIGTTSKSCNVQLASVSNTQTAYTFTPTPGVVHYVAIKATNLVGTSSYSTEASFSIPSFTQPVNQSSPVGVAITPLNMSVTDPDGSARNFTHTGLPTGLALNATTGQITGTPSAAGTYNVTVFANDSLVTVSRSFVWTITAAAADTTAPALSITSHTNGQTLSAASVTISGTASDSGRGGNGVSSVMVNGQAATGGSATASATASWSRTLTLAQGANTITVQATDSRGNNATQSITLNYVIAPVPNLNPTISITSTANFETTNTTTTITATVADPNGSVASVGWARTYPTTASGPCSVVSGTATCSGVGLVGKANNAFTLTVTDNNGAMATATWNALRRTCEAIPSDDFDVDGGWPASLGPCFTPMTTAALSIANGNAAASSAATRHLSLRPWTGGAPDDYKVQVTSTSQVTESSFLLFGCFASTTSQGIYNGYVMSMQGLGTSLARYDNGIRTSLTATTQPADGGWSPQEIGTLECEDTGTSTVLTAKDQFGAIIIAATDLTAGRYTSGDPFVGAWGGATFDLFVATEINTPPPAQVTSATLTSTVASPQNTNTAVTFTAGATGGAAPQQFKFLVQPAGGVAQVMQNWSTATTYAWTPTTAGTYTVMVWARSAGVTVDAAQASAQMAYVVNTPPPAPVTSAALTSTVASPQNTGTAITFIANSSGGVASHQFKFLVQPTGGAAQVVQNWSTATTYAWTPTTAGTYTVMVWARSAGVTVDAAQASAQMAYVVNTPPPASVTSVALTSNLATPQNTGTNITFFTAGAGGEAPHQFKFLVQPAGGVAQVVQPWSTATTYTWKPLTAGTYTVMVWARSAGATVDAAQASAQMAYVVNTPPPAPVASVALTSNLATPQNTGTNITFFTAGAGGEAPQQFKFLVQPAGGAAQVVQPWSTATTYTWKPLTAGTYTVMVWARSAGVTVDAAQASAQMAYAVNTPPPAPVASVALTSNLATPQNTGTNITFFTAGAGGVAPHQFKFLVQPAGGAAQVVQNWSTATTYTWTPATAGTYTVIAWARSAGVTVDAAQASAQMAYAVNPAPIAPVTSATLTPNLASPQGTGTSITFAAAASGGVGPQQYKFLLQSTGGAAQIVQNWGTATTYTWTPAATGDYIVTVWARSAGATVDAAQASAQVMYPVIASGVNPVSVSPSSGSGSAQTFTLAYSDSRGASNLVSEWVWFVGGTGVCMAYHERATNLVYLLNDAGTAWTSKMLGSASVLQGSSCAINLGSSSASASGSGLTLNLAIAFTPAFSGEKTIRMFANAAGGVSSGWQDRGSWTVTSSAPAPAPTTTRGRKKPRAITETSTAAPEPTPTPTLTSGPLTITGVTSNLASPQIAGTSITFFAGATGGSGPYQFKWFIFDGVSWTVARDWSSATTLEWRPTTRGTYGIGIWVRDATTTADVGTVSWSASYRINKAGIGG